MKTPVALSKARRCISMGERVLISSHKRGTLLNRACVRYYSLTDICDTWCSLLVSNGVIALGLRCHIFLSTSNKSLCSAGFRTATCEMKKHKPRASVRPGNSTPLLVVRWLSLRLGC